MIIEHKSGFWVQRKVPFKMMDLIQAKWSIYLAPWAYFIGKP